MAQNPHQGPSPHMFGNYNAPPNAFPQMAPHMGIQRPMQTPGNPNMSMMQPTFPSQYSNMPMHTNPPTQQQPQPSGRPREWQDPSQQLPYERDSKRPRPFPQNPNDPNFPTNHPSSVPPMQQMQQQIQTQPQQQQVAMNPNQMHNPFVPHGQPMPRMQPNPNPSLQMNQTHGSFPMNQNQFRTQPPMPGPQINDNDPRNPYQFTQKPNPPQNPQPPMQQNAFERNPSLHDKEFSRPTDPRASHKHNNNEDSSDDGDKNQQEVMSFKDFLAKQPDSISPQDAKAAYDRYIMDVTARKPNRFFDLHKDEEWFKERYYPEYVSARIVRVREEVQERAKVYREIWDKGGSKVCAPDLSSSLEKRGRSDTRIRHEKDKKGKFNDKEAELSTKDDKIDEKPDDTMNEDSVHASNENKNDSDNLMTENTDEKPTKDLKLENTSENDKKTESMEIDPTNIKEGNDEVENPEKKSDVPQNLSKSEDRSEEHPEKEESVSEKPAAVLESLKDEKTEQKMSENSKSEGEDSTSASAKREEGIKNEDTVIKQEDNILQKDGEDVPSTDTSAKEELSNVKTEETGDVPQPGNTGDKEEIKAELIPEDKREDDDPEKMEHVEGEISADEEEAPNSDPELMLPLRRGFQENTIFLRGIPTNLSRGALTEVLKHGPDGKMDLKFRRLKLGDINPQRRLERFGWAVYDSEASASRALEMVKGIVVKTKKKNVDEKDKTQASDTGEDDANDDPESIYEIDCMLNLQRRKKYTQGKVLPPIFSTKSRMQHDVVQGVKIMRFLDNLRQLEKDLNPLTDEFLQGLESDAKRLDHLVTYLREVHYYCYYSGNEFLEDPTSMPPQELRPAIARDDMPSDADNRILKRVDERAKWVLDRDYDRPRSNSDNGEKAKEEAITKWLDSNTKNEGNGRFRCGLPPHKLFKGPEFVHKHLRTKHIDKMKKIEQKAMLATYRDNFENDPSKKEVIDIYNEGSMDATDGGKPMRGRHSDEHSGRRGHGYNQGNEDFQRAQVPVGMYNTTTPFIGMGVQPFPMMMMSASGFPGGYAGATGYPNAMNFTGRAMNTGMPQNGMMGVKGNEGRRSHRRDRDRDYRDGGYRGNHRGSRSGGKRERSYGRRGGEKRHRGDDKHLDPRASGPRRSYNDLDAPANGPSFDLVRYDDDV